MKELRTLVIRLFLITAVAGLVLALANTFTAPVIAEQKAKKLAESLKDAFPTAEKIEPMDKDEMTKTIGDNEAVKDIYNVTVGGEVKGFIFRTVAKGGFDGPIEFIVGVSKEGNIEGFKVLNNTETPGFGKQCETPAFAEGVTGNKVDQDLTYAETPSTNYDIQAISGSTITTKAIVGGLNNTIAIARELIK